MKITIPGTTLISLVASALACSAQSVSKNASIDRPAPLTTVTNVFNVQRFGAIPNDNIDDSASIQKAIETAPNNSTIYFPSGNYICGGLDVQKRAGLSFVGDGPGRSVLKRRPNPPRNDGRISTVTDCSDMTFTQLGFDMNGLDMFGGAITCYTGKRITIARNRFFDSQPPPRGQSDRYPMCFGAAGHEDIHIIQNVVEDLQIEVDNARRVVISGNTVMRPVNTSAIGLFTISNAANGGAQDYEIIGNLIIDPVVSGGGIVVHLDPPGDNNSTFRNIRISDNVIQYTAALATGDAKRGFASAVRLGTGDNSVATKGNIFDHITIENNMVWVDPTLTGIDFNGPILFGNSSAKANFKFDNLKVRNNHIFYNGKAPSVAFAQTGANYVAEGNILTPISKPPASPAATSK